MDKNEVLITDIDTGKGYVARSLAEAKSFDKTGYQLCCDHKETILVGKTVYEYRSRH